MADALYSHPEILGPLTMVQADRSSLRNPRRLNEIMSHFHSPIYYY